MGVCISRSVKGLELCVHHINLSMVFLFKIPKTLTCINFRVFTNLKELMMRSDYVGMGRWGWK